MRPKEMVGRKVGAARALRGMSQRELAEVMSRLGHDWSFRTVSRVETGARDVFVGELTALTLALGETLEWFLTPPTGEWVEFGSGIEVSSQLAYEWARGDWYWRAEWDENGKLRGPIVVRDVQNMRIEGRAP